MANNGGTNVSTANTTEFWPCGGQVNKTTTETSVQLIFRTAGTATNMQINLSANSIASAATVIDFRINAASSALTITVGSSQTGKLEDVTHNVSITAGQKGNFRTVPGTTTGTMTPQTMGISYDTGSTTVQKNAAMNPAGKAVTTASTATFWAISNNIAGSTATETSSQCLIKQAGTAQNMQVNVSANARTTATTFDLRKAAASLTQTISYGSTVTGFLEDTTHTDALVAGDKINYRQLTGTGIQSLTTVAIGVDISSSAGYGPLVIDTGGGSAQTSATTRWNSIQGSLSLASTETSAQYKVESAFVFSNMNVHVLTNTASTLTYTLRKNVAASALTFVTTSATTGWFEDTTHTVTAVAADLYDMESVTGAGGVVTWTCGVIYTQLITVSGILTTVYVEWEEG